MFGFCPPSLCLCQYEPLAEGRKRRECHASLPYAVYGHFDVKNTLYYFHFVPGIYGRILDRSRHSEELIPEVDDGRKK